MSNRSAQPQRWAVDLFRLIVAVGALWLGIVADAKAAELQRLQLEVLINGAPTNLIGSFVRDGEGRIGAAPTELETIGIRVDRNTRQSQVVFLDSLPGIRYDYDMPAQRLLVTAADNRRIPKVYDLRPEQKAKVAPRTDYGAVLNYNVFAASDNSTGLPRFNFQGASTTLDARVFTPFGTASQSGILRSAPDNDNAFLRLDSRFTYSDPARMMTYVAGDAITNGFAWTRPIRIGGFQAGRNFALRPDLVTMPLPSASGSAAVPSTLDVYVNNIKAFSQDVQAGPYNVTNIPAVTGAGDAKVVVRDASGRETQTSLPFFTSSWLLKPSLTDFSVEVGAPRQFYGTSDDSYVARPVVSASLRRGITDSLTLESHGEGGLGLVNGGVGVAFRTGSFGVADVALSASRFDNRTGLQAYGAYSVQARGLNLNVSTLRRFGDYSDLASVTSALRPGMDLNIAGTAPFYKFFTSFDFDTRPAKAVDRVAVGTTWPGQRATGNIAFTHIEYADGTHSKIISSSLGKELYRNTSITATAFTDLSNRKSFGFFVGLSIPLNGGGVVSTGASCNSGSCGAAIDAAKPLGLDSGSVGWRAHAERDNQLAAGSYRSNYGWAEAQVRHDKFGTQTTGQIDGSLVAMGGGVFAANRIDDSFAVVETGVPNVEVSSENRPIGKTDASGRLLVTRLRSYQDNKITIDTGNLPVDAEIGTTKEIVVPADRSGVKVKFPIKTNANAAVVIIVMADGKPVAAGTQGTLPDGSTFFVGYDGRAFVSGLAHHNVATISLPAASCHASFDFSPKRGAQVEIGPVVCR